MDEITLLGLYNIHRLSALSCVAQRLFEKQGPIARNGRGRDWQILDEKVGKNGESTFGTLRRRGRAIFLKPQKGDLVGVLRRIGPGEVLTADIMVHCGSLFNTPITTLTPDGSWKE
jgi:hypothetical protein